MPRIIFHIDVNSAFLSWTSALWASEQVSPLTQVLFFPGLPALALLAGLFAGWRFWKWFWRPRVVDGR